MKIRQGFKIQFSCGHLYQQSAWSEAKNKKEFGLCYNKYGHGHDYSLWVEIESTDQSALAKYKNKLDELKGILDHQHLNFQIQEFKNQIPTTENLLLFCKDYLIKKDSIFLNAKLTLFENPHLGAQI